MQIPNSGRYIFVRVCVCLCSVMSDSCILMDCRAAGTSLHGIFQSRILEWVAISSFRGSSRFRNQTHISVSSALASRFFTTLPSGKPWKIFFNSDSNVGDQKFTLRDLSCILRNPKRRLKQVKDIQGLFVCCCYCFKISLVDTLSIDFTG